MDELPFVDEHARLVPAPADRAWEGLLRALPAVLGRPGAGRYARVVGCDPAGSDGRFPAEGSTLPGFRVEHVEPLREILLLGRHRFSDYAFRFRLAREGDGATRLSAETRAAFPGLAGAAYRVAVIRTGIHARLVRRLLRAADAAARDA